MGLEGRGPLDPKGLIHDAYRIDGIRIEECRSIFLDWALSLKEAAPVDAIPAMLEAHGQDPEHPMTLVLREGLEDAPKARRRGGRAARVPVD